MPIFEFRCETCAHLEEVLQKYGDPPPDPCPACGAEGTMRKEVSLTSFQLKGGGWYKDLYSSTPSSGGGEEKSGTKASSDKGTKGNASASSGSSSASSPSSTSSAPANKSSAKGGKTSKAA